jgi:Zn-dependent alcohol dehydrogenase
MRAVGEPLVVEELDLDAPGPGEVEVRIQATGICHSDLHYLSGALTAKTPIVLGHEGAGIVTAVGDGVTGYAPGDHVVLLWRPRCGQCENCLQGRPALCTSGRVHATENSLLRGGTRLHRNGADVYHLMGDSCFAERAVVSQESIVKVGADIPAPVAAIVGCAVITGIGAVVNTVEKAAAGTTVVIVGAGGVGLSAVLGAGLIGASRIIVADLVDARLEKARELGATDVIRSDEENLAERVREITGGGAHYVFDTTGVPAVIRSAFEALRAGGVLTVMGLGATTTEFTLPLNLMVQNDRQVRGSLYGSANTPLQIPRILDLYRSGRLPLEKLLDREFALDEVNEAFAYLRDGAVGRPVVTFPAATVA